MLGIPTGYLTLAPGPARARIALRAGGTGPRTLGIAAVGGLAALVTCTDRRLELHHDPAPASHPAPDFHPASASHPAVIRRPAPTGDHARPLRTRLTHRPSAAIALRTGAAVLTAGAAATAAGTERPYCVMATAAAVLSRGTTAAVTRDRAVLRAAGTLAGTAVAAGVTALHPTGVTAAMVLGTLIVLADLSAAPNYFLAMLFVTPMAIVLTEASGAPADTPTLLMARLVETFAGATAAVLVTHIPLPQQPPQPRHLTTPTARAATPSARLRPHPATATTTARARREADRRTEDQHPETPRTTTSPPATPRTNAWTRALPGTTLPGPTGGARTTTGRTHRALPMAPDQHEPDKFPWNMGV